MKIEDNPGTHTGIGASGRQYADNVVLRGSRGHGFAAEKANHLADRVRGRNAQHVGGDNRRNGPDRVVDGTEIQSKYCRTGSACIGECFQDGRFRYMTADGPMRIEVPSDKYGDAVRAMEHRIRDGQVPGVSDPEQAKAIVRKGTFSYGQVRNIAKFGSIEGLTYDAVNGIRLAGSSMGISFVVTVAMSVWDGREFKAALRSAVVPTLKVGALTCGTSMLAAQVGRTSIEAKVRPATDRAVKWLGPKASSWIAKGVRSGPPIHGVSATNHLSKLMRGQAVTAGLTMLVLSAPDAARLFRREISCSQAFKNVAIRGGGVAGGTGGWLVGAAVGASAGSVVPLVGTAFGGVAGGILGSTAGAGIVSKAASVGLDTLIEDDAETMLKIVEAVFSDLARDYLLVEREAEGVIDELRQCSDFGSRLQEMFCADDRADYARRWLLPLVEQQVERRKTVEVRLDDHVLGSVEEILFN